MLSIDDRVCLVCAGCLALCPELALEIVRNKVRVNDAQCTGCCLCVDFCPMLALSLDNGGRGG